MSTPPASFSPVTQVLDPSAPAPPEEKVSEEQFNLLHASSVTYRDLLIFEERLKLNMFRLRKRQQKYEAFLGSLIAVIAYCTFATFYRPSQFFLLLSCTTMFLFFATGMYSEKLGYSSKFVPQCNRVLWIFNMHFNRDNRPELSFFRKVPKKFQEGFSAYKASYFKRRAEKRAAAALAKAKGGLTASSGGTGAGGMMNATGMNRTASGQNRRLHSGVASRGRRVAGSGSASGSDSGAARSSISSNRALGSSRFSDEGVRPLRSLTATSSSSSSSPSHTMSSSSKTASTAPGSVSK
ncbi:hypothetical protein BG011_005415 [Mortierella polycephala]|uniref:Transmembrane protein 188 n=1 Tax=Mortierella polycephala TaxID=41804 RepID=A0A9P6U0Z5_9FUNG|nr:hypothetical protein BG011_005415 [Mortierella polycephala]